MSTFSEDSNEFMLPPDSPGSSVSSRLQDEYDELLRFAVVVPSYDVGSIPRTLQDLKGSFPALSNNHTQQTDEGAVPDVQEQDEDTTIEEDSSEHDAVVNQRAVVRLRPAYDDRTPSVEDYQQSTPLDSMSQSSIPTDMAITVPKLATMPMGDPLKAKLFMRPDSPCSTVSGYTNRDSEVGSMMSDDMGYSLTIDQDLSRMENLLDQWTGDIKRNVLAEFGQAKIKLIGFHKKQAQKDREKHMAEQQRLYSEMDGLRELLHTYEQSIERKDQVISNLTRGLQKQREKFEMMKTFSEWKISHNDKKREAVAGNLAEKHYTRHIQQKCWAAWHSIVESKWRERVEKACQSKAQEVCMSLTNDYETKIASLNEALAASREEVLRLHSDRDQYEETMKKAFMRGVCALNMEAMSMFHEQDEKGSDQGATNGEDMQVPFIQTAPSHHVNQPEEYYVTTMNTEPMYSSNPPGAPAPPRVVTSQASSRGVVVGNKAITSQARPGITSAKSNKPKIVTAKITGSMNAPRGGALGNTALAPPMSSVVVERHQPVVKQTVGHATASRYVRPTDSIGQPPTNKPTMQRKIAGQNVQSVKVVE